MMIRITDIRRDEGTQFREGLDPAIVAEYTEALRRGEKLTPPVVFGDDNILADGYHTVAAHEAWNPKKKLEVVSMSGTLEDARWYAATQANRNHGSRLSNEAKRRRVAYVLGARPDLSDREISRECGVSHTFVAAQRAAPSGNVATLPAGGEPTAARLEAGGPMAGELRAEDVLPLEAQTCLLCLPWRERAIAAENSCGDWQEEARAFWSAIPGADSCEGKTMHGELCRWIARATAAEAELRALRNQMQGLQLRAEAAEAERPAGGATVELAYERDPLSRLPKPAKPPKKPAKRRAVPRG